MYIHRILQKELEASLQNKKVLLLLGARQVGKTTLIEQLQSQYQGQLLNMDIDVDRARIASASKLAPQEAMRALGASSLLVIDEAHRAPNIGRITKGWYDAKVKPKIILLGSSSATLLDIASAELTGRNEKFWLTPFLFQEILGQKSWWAPGQSPKIIQQDFKDQVDALMLQRLVYGNYPEAYTTADTQKYLDNLSSDYLLKDIFTESKIRSPEDVRRLLRELANEIGNTVTVLQLATRLKLSRQTITKYLQLLESIFIIFSVPSYSTDPFKEINKSEKYYFWDNGVKNAIQRQWEISEHRGDINQLWQNWVMAEIFKQSKTFNRQEELFFWETRNGSKVDLIVRQGSEIHPFQIAYFKNEANSSRAFTNAYQKNPTIIHPGNILEILQ